MSDDRSIFLLSKVGLSDKAVRGEVFPQKLDCLVPGFFISNSRPIAIFTINNFSSYFYITFSKSI